ncbi:hypothetical protein YWH7199_00670 [Fusobacterium nucleatum YWH7199]|uniref:phage protein GemA/Gp16 family protein n=1 Tax=Fusobacterium nucleatum TaxID=851 RepID=UPI00201B0373|nr:phage protein GemA/Gp16 family protein [Fusobacterium nucleatum]MCL4580076.1 hypothetical protein [Fusobacterium nucleatum YWH7199]
MKEIKKHQIKYIHTLKHKAGLKDEDYRLLLKSKFNKNSSKDLSYNQAEILIKILDRLINDYATEKQKNKLNSLYRKVYKEKDKKEFIEEYLGKGKTENNMSIQECSKLIYILEEIVEWHEKRKLKKSNLESKNVEV